MFDSLKNSKRIFWLFVMTAGFLNAQTLTVSRGANDHAASFEDPDGQNVSMIQINMSASGGDIEVTNITVDPISTGINRAELVDTEILIYHDVNGNGVLESGTDVLVTSANYGALPDPIQGFETPAAAVVLTVPNWEILSGTSQDWIVVHSYDGGDDNNNFTVDITGASVAVGSVTGTPITGNTKTFETAVATQNVALFAGEGGSNPISRNVNASATNEVMLQIILATSTLDTATVSQIDFDMSGSGEENNDLTSAKLYHDVDANGVLNLEQDVQIGSTISSFSDNGTLSFSGLSEEINAGAFEHWIVVYDFNGSAGNGETFAVDLSTNGDITASALNAAGATVSGAPANGNTATISATGSLTLSLGSNSPGSSSISASESEFEMIQINLAANATEDIEITAFKFATSGTANESTDIDSAIFFKDVNSNGIYDILYDIQLGSTVTSFTDNDTITFTATDTVAASGSNDYGLLYWLNGNGSADETFKVYFDVAAQITATGLTSTNSISALGLPVSGSTMTISTTGTLTIAVAGTNPGNENFEGSATNMTMLAMTISANDVEDIDIDDITVTPSTNDMVRNDIDNTEVNIYEDVDENGSLNVAVDRFITSANYNSTLGIEAFTPTAVTIPITGETIAANSSVQWLIVNTINTGSTVGDFIEVSVLNTGISGTGQTSSGAANISGPSLYGGIKTHVTGIPGSITLSEGPQNPAFRLISAGTQNETMLQFQLTADAIEDIDITQFSIITSGTGNESNDVDSVRLFLDGDNNGSLNLLNDTQLGSTISSLTDNATLNFSSFNDTLSAGSAKNYIVVYNYNSANNTVGETFKAVIGDAYVTATGITSTSGITPTGGPANGGLVTITDTGTLTVSAGANNPGATNVANSDNNVTTIQMNITAGSNEDVTITAVTFTLSGTFDDATDFEAASFRLYDDDNGNGAVDGGESQLGTGQDPTGNNGTVTFSGLSETILADTDVNWIVLVNLNGSASNFENFRVSFANSAHMTATGDDTGDPIYPDGIPVQGGLFTVGATGSLSLTTGSNNPATGTENPSAQDVEMLQLRLSASGVENITVSTISFTADGTGGEDTDITSVTLYLDVNNDGQLDGGDTQIATGAFAADNGTISYTGLTEVITAGTNENWLLVYDFGAGATNGETYRVGIYNATQITSTGVTSGNPITETGFPVVSNYKTITNIGTMSLFAGDLNPGAANIDSPTDYEVLQIKLSVSTIESIDVDDLTITHIGTGDPVNDIASAGVQLVRDNNNNGAYDSGTDDILATTDYSGSTATFTLAPITIAVDNTENWLVMYDFVYLQVGETYRARLASLTDLGLTGVTSSQSITASGSVPISGGTMTVDNDFGLPVELTSFVATGDHGFINLDWVTESEINNLGFSIERKLSSDEHFTVIASYASYTSLLGAGNASSQTEYVFNDSTVIPEKEYTYRLIQHDYSGALNIQEILASATAKEPLPTKFELAQNYPNPFNPETTIKVAVPEQSRIKVTIFNILGQQVLQLVNDEFQPGHYKIKWDGTNQQGVQTSSGLYFYVLQVKSAKGTDMIKSRKMIKLQ